ncbi:carbonic anhydrase [Legionella pneumophila]|uniref:carbonic anhydrase n=1 Tax=Legionella pneumophila subsp. pascullei TaxID=91890 RepID=A0AAX2IZU1_LEGPN|nr:carbonic anhydrase [Legionella pneumophila]AMP88881.1 carbonic anhydrase [Legionella pneumophila subsp. pascullei]AMP93451.1 carbonic anhydrase [Legionella pneumophila subsp. pascullei]AMP96419.1 carbonic anhydrase [Legionella pneumophila subsp. pascullei]SQG91395.1 (beta)-carbonic anhydrase [Legionella pneumophila subsp. pascullei]VEH07941.1 (beta)-carbonic anhydrase [Legionella pneumophila subsp. pascullei]
MLIKLMLGLLEFKKKPFIGMRDLFEQLSTGQNPETLFITCSDSRIVPSLITQAAPGDLFSIRNIGNIIPPYPSSYSETGAIEYALKVLEIKDIIICGHSNCGAMKGLLTPHIEEHLPAVASWLNHSQAVLQEMHEERMTETNALTRELEIATKKNILLQMEHLKTYPLVIEKTTHKELTIHGWYYELETGQVFIYEPDLKEFINLEYALDRALESRKNKIVSGLCMNYLQQKIPLKSEKEYHQLIELITNLKDNILSIWEFIREPAKQQLWKELGGFYASPEDEEFIAMVESSTSLKLTELEEFRKKVTFTNNNTATSLLLNSSIFKKPTKDIGKPNADPVISGDARVALSGDRNS